MDAHPLLGRDPEIMCGALCFTGTRVPVKNLFDYLEGASTLEDFLEDFPSISRETAVAVLEAARVSSATKASSNRSWCWSADIVRRKCMFSARNPHDGSFRCRADDAGHELPALPRFPEGP